MALSNCCWVRPLSTQLLAFSTCRPVALAPNGHRSVVEKKNVGAEKRNWYILFDTYIDTLSSCSVIPICQFHPIPPKPVQTLLRAWFSRQGSEEQSEILQHGWTAKRPPCCHMQKTNYNQPNHQNDDDDDDDDDDNDDDPIKQIFMQFHVTQISINIGKSWHWKWLYISPLYNVFLYRRWTDNMQGKGVLASSPELVDQI